MTTTIVFGGSRDGVPSMTTNWRYRAAAAWGLLWGGTLLLTEVQTCLADDVVADDLIVQGSLGVGPDVINNESFGADTVRLKGGDLRIHFDDTSASAGFPANDWRILINDTTNGGANFFAIEDSTGARVPFTITAGAASNSFVLDSTGRVGLRTAAPVLDLHLATGNTPAFRLEQTNAGGFTAQTWDIAGNDANFFVRDVTGGSLLPLRIRPGAPTSSLDIAASGNVGMGTANPAQKLHLSSTAGSVSMRLQEDSSVTPQTWDIEGSGLGFNVKDVDAATIPFTVLPDAPTNSLLIDPTGNVGVGAAIPNQIGAATLTGRVLNLRTDAAGTAGVARFVAQGASGSQLDLVHLGGPVNQKVLRIQNAAGITSFSMVNDALSAHTVTSAIAIKNLNGNIGLRQSNPTHPLHLASGAHCTDGGVWTNASSRELKQDIHPLTGELAAASLQKLQPVGYRYKNELDETYVGFIAEDVPDLVATGDRKALAEMDIAAVLTKSVQDQQARLLDERTGLLEEQRRIDRQQTVIEDQQRRLEHQEKLLAERSRLLQKLTQRMEQIERRVDTLPD